MHLLHGINNQSLASINHYITGLGAAAPAVFYFGFIIQAMVPVFPYIVVAAAAGAMFGFKAGFLLSWLGSVSGCLIGFLFCKYLGADWAREKVLTRYGYDVANIQPETAFWAIVVASIIPFLPTPVVNATAGLSGISFRNFFVSILIGKIPTAVLYTGLGVTIFGMRDVRLTLIIITCIIILVAVGRRVSKGRFSLTRDIDPDS